jgi:hypothetical protein
MTTKDIPFDHYPFNYEGDPTVRCARDMSQWPCDVEKMREHHVTSDAMVTGHAITQLMEWCEFPFGDFVIESYRENEVHVWTKKPDGTIGEGVQMTVAEAIEEAIR